MAMFAAAGFTEVGTHLPQQTGDAARAVIETSIALGA
jgi:hypothetical protein